MSTLRSLGAGPVRHAGQGPLLAVFDALSDAAAIVDGRGVVTHVNTSWETFAALNGGDAATTGVGTDYFHVCRAAAAGGDPDADAVAAGLEGVLSGRLRAFEHRYPCPSPVEERWFVVRVAPLRGAEGALVTHLDVTAAKLAEDRLAFRATHDPLTGLPNRDEVLSALRASLARRNRSGGPVAVLFLDLDDFKPVNDRYGHATGDRVLALVAHRLRRQLRTTDTVGRVGGDEFVAVCEASEAAGLVARLRSAVSSPVQLGADTVRVGVSIGVAVAPEPGSEAPEEVAQALLAEADQAMYEDKRRRRAS